MGEIESCKFDANGDYIKKWAPELAKVPPKAIHTPWKNPLILESADVKLGKDYPCPIVNHDTAKKAALKEFHRVA